MKKFRTKRIKEKIKLTLFLYSCSNFNNDTNGFFINYDGSHIIN